MAERKILHLDLDAFFCSVEELLDPSLRGKAFAVGGRPDQRGVVASCSYAARRAGIHSAMPMSRALRLLPELIIVSSRHHEYGRRSDEVMAILSNWTPLMEQVSVDEAFLDLTDLPDDLESLARRVQAEIREKTGLPCSLGCAGNKLVAKIANDVGKSKRKSNSPPNAITIVPPGTEAEFLAPLPVKALWGVGEKTAERLNQLGFFTAGQLALAEEKLLTREFGKYGRFMRLAANGMDDTPIVTEHEVKSISQEVTFERDVSDEDRLVQMLRDLSGQVAYRLRKNRLEGLTVRIKIRWSDFSTHTRQVTLAESTCQDSVIFSTARSLFDSVWPPGRPVRLIGVGVAGLEEPARQLPLWDTQDEKERRLLNAVDSLRGKYGKTAIKRGDQLARDRENNPSGKRGTD